MLVVTSGSKLMDIHIIILKIFLKFLPFVFVFFSDPQSPEFQLFLYPPSPEFLINIRAGPPAYFQME